MVCSIDEQLEILMRGVEYGDQQIYETMREELRERLSSSLRTGEPLRVYCGYDPTAPDLHLGHTVTMRKMRQFQELDHQAVFVIGNYTALIGDASDRDSARPRPSPEMVARNARTYAEQAFRILDPDRTEVRYNGEWLSQLTFEDLVHLASQFTVQQFLARDNFTKRYEKGDPIWLHELFYALMQGYDAVVLKADVQLGATEQLFNLLAGRKLQKVFGQKPQIAITMPILVGTDGTVRMSKSLGNYIGISEPPKIIYAKVMSIPDTAMRNYFMLVTRWAPNKIGDMLSRLQSGRLHPMTAKKMLAWEITDSLYGSECADLAAAHFERVHQEGDLPDDMPTYALTTPMKVVEILADAGLTASKSQARRLIQQGGVKLDGEKLDSIDIMVNPGNHVLRVGKRRFLKLLQKI